MKYFILLALIFAVVVYSTPHHGNKGPSSTKTSQEDHHKKKKHHTKKTHKKVEKKNHRDYDHYKNHKGKNIKKPHVIKAEYHFKSFTPHKKQTHCLNHCFYKLSHHHRKLPEYKKNFICHKKCGVALVSVKHLCKNYPNLCKFHKRAAKHHMEPKGANGAMKAFRIKIPFEMKSYSLKKHNEIHDSLKQVGDIKPSK